MTTAADTFNRADNATSLGTASDGGSWTVDGGTWGIASNKGYLADNTTGSVRGSDISNQRVARRDAGSVAAFVQVTNARGVNAGRATLWVALDPSTGTGYYAWFSGATTAINIYKTTATNTSSLLGSVTPTSWIGSSAVLKLTYDGAGAVKFYQDGALLGTVTDSSPITGGSNTWVGIGSNTTSAAETWDDFSADTLSGTAGTSASWSRSARGFTANASSATAAATSLATTRAARAFALAAAIHGATSATWTRTARGFSTAAGVTVGSGAGRPDADTATGWTRLDRTWIAGAEAEPPVDPPPATSPVRLYRRHSYTVTPPTFADDGWSNPKQTRTLINGAPVGRHRFKFGGIDRTYFRGVPMRLLEDTHANPFGPGIMVFHFPQISPFERPGVGDLAWLHDGTGAHISLVKPDGTIDQTWALVGFVHNITPEFSAESWGFTVEAKGWMWQGDDTINKPLPTQQGGSAVPIGERVADVFNHIETRHFPGLVAVDTSPAVTRKRGSLSQSRMAFIRDLLADAWTSSGRQWTVMDKPEAPMMPEMVLPDPTSIDYTISVGQEGVQFDLHEEQDELPNVIYGEWIDPNGGRHQRLKYPRLHEDQAPGYPLSVGAVFFAGSGTTGFAPFADWMRRNGFSGFDSDDTYLASDEDDVRDAQDRMGITVDGIVGAQTWGTAFNTGADVGSLRSAIYLPIAADPRVMSFLYAPDGTKLGPNPAYVPSQRRKETYINFGEGLTYRDVRRSAQQIVTRNITGISLVGQITLSGTDFEEIWRGKARAGTTLRVRYLYDRGSSGVLFHIANVHRTYGDDGSITAILDVDTKWRDAFTVAQIRERNKAARDDPARALRRRQTSGLAQDTKLQFDADDVGRIYRHNVQGGFWRVVEFPAATWGSFVHVTAVTSPATEFALMLFEKEITPRDLDRLVGNPLSSAHPYNPSATALRDAGLVQAWGSADQPCGYSKSGAADGYKSDSDPLTGRLEYDSNVDFAPENGASLFLAEWCRASTVIRETLKLQPVAV